MNPNGVSKPPSTAKEAGPAQSNIDSIVKLEEEFRRQRSFADRMSDIIANFVGSIPFVVLHLVWFGAWVAINFHWFAAIPAFDPYPYQLLCMIVSLEGVLLSTFVLIKQNRMSQRSDQRSHLDLQINLLSEKEITKLMQMQRMVCQKLGIEEAEQDAEVLELSEATAVGNLARELRDRLPEE